jgi:hypothetical protein
MKFILFLLLFLSTFCYSQIEKDTIVEEDTIRIIRSSWYVRGVPFSIVTGAGSNQAPTYSRYIEGGWSYEVLDLGLAIGSYSRNMDTTTFAELKITMDASQYGIFSNEFSVGFGRVFKSSTPIMLEASYTIMAQLSNNIGAGIYTGFYDFVGTDYDITKSYYGVFIRFGLARNSDGEMYIKNKTHHRKKRIF